MRTMRATGDSRFRSAGAWGAGSPGLARVALPLLAWLALAPAGPAGAQAAPAPGPPAPAPTVDDPRARLAEVETEVARLDALRREWDERTAGFAQAREKAPESLAAIEAEIAELQRREVPRVDPRHGVEELETEALSAEQDLTLARKDALALEAEAAGRAERRKQIPELLASAKERLLALEGETAPPASDPALAEARQRLLRARREALQSEARSYEEELRSYDARGQLLARRRDRAALRVASLDLRVAALHEALTARRRGEAEIDAEAARRSLEAAEAMPPVVLERLRDLATENRDLALRRTGPEGLLQRIAETSAKLTRADEQVAGVTADLERLRRKVEVAGLSGSVGLLLRKTRTAAPDVGKYERFIRMRRDEISEVQLQQIELSEQREALADVDELVAETMAGLEPVLSPDDTAAVEALLRNLLETRRRYLDTLIADTETLFQSLVDFDARQRELVARTRVLLRFIDRRVFWIPSGKALSPSLADDAAAALAWLLAPRFLSQVPRALGASIDRAPIAFATASLLLLATPLAWPRLRRRVEALGRQAARSDCIRIAPTAGALVLSLVLAAWAPGLLGFLGWELRRSVDATQFVRCLASGLLAASLVWLTLGTFRQLLRRGGIATAHLGWPDAPSRDLRWHLGWLTAVAVPAVFAIGIFELRGEDAWRESVGRIAFLAAMVALLTFAHLVLREHRGALRRIAAARPELSLPPAAWRALHAAAPMAAFALGAAAAAGYYWTALRLAASLHATFVFLFLLVFVYQLGSRWSLLASRRLALRRWLEAQAARESRTGAVPDAAGAEREEPALDLATVDAQTGRLLRNGALLVALIGLWVIWSDLFPAAGALGSVELWKTTVPATVEIANAAGERTPSIEERLVPITLADLMLALLVGAVTLAVARNLRGVLEVTVFRQLQTRAGERYAYGTIATYAVTLAGVAAALSVVGVGWSQIQWLVAAVGIGLGFGLQEIFANFISGLIILFERPIRVGDTVTVGDISGTVSRIRIRATWITGFDRKELVVPNKEFVTGRLVNWSLSDAILRVEVPVGIAYGSDTEKACRVLREVAQKHPHILKEPPPYVLFRGFGESSLDFELRVFSPDITHYLEIVHDLHMEIDRLFREEGIAIAFPQRDLHVRSLPVSPQDGEPKG
jgi:potassium efflux system protein